MERDGKTDTHEYKEKMLEAYEAQLKMNEATAKFDSADMKEDLFILGEQLGLQEDDVKTLILELERLDRMNVDVPVTIGGQTNPDDIWGPGGPTPGVPFQTGGIVPGPTGAAVPILAHAGEVVLNPQQQRALLNGQAGGGLTINVTAGTIVTENELEDIMIRVMARYGLRNRR
jgi:hypothetical protein